MDSFDNTDGQDNGGDSSGSSGYSWTDITNYLTQGANAYHSINDALGQTQAPAHPTAQPSAAASPGITGTLAKVGGNKTVLIVGGLLVLAVAAFAFLRRK